MNNGGKDTSNSDVQKLQEQLNDIKEQVRKLFLRIYLFVIKLQCTNLITTHLPYFVSDNVPSMFGSTEEYDISVWPWNLSDVWRPNVGMPDMQKNC